MNILEKLSLQGRRALVCGASQGIGLACAQLLAQQGCQVVAVARRQEVLSDVLKTLSGSGHQILALDLANTTQLMNELKSMKAVDIVINNAGGPPAGDLIEAQSEGFLKAFHEHILAAQLIAQATVPNMKANSYGRIINVISTSVKVPLAQLGVSNTIRGAMAAWAKSMANELGPYGITVNNILPGYTLTPRLETLKKNTATKSGRSENEIAEAWKQTIPLKRFAQPEEIAWAVAFLASPAASYISGINLPVDGGRTPTL